MQNVIIKKDMKEEKKYFNSLGHQDDKVNKVNEFDEKLPMDAMLENADTLSASSTSRRDFLKFLGFSSVAATLASCEAPVVKSIPYLNKPETITPGNPTYYASSYFSENVFASLLVKTREGRPILLSSNNNPEYGGGINARCQASVLSLYDSNRLKNPVMKAEETSWESIDKVIVNKLKNTSQKIVLVSSTIISPSTRSYWIILLKNIIILVMFSMMLFLKIVFFHLTKDVLGSLLSQLIDLIKQK